METVDINSKLCDLTVNQFIQVVVFIVMFFVFSYVFFKIGNFIVDFTLSLIRKDKFRSGRYVLYMRALRHMARLRRQVKNARSEKAYFLFYNRLIGAYETYVELGILGNNPKLIDVRGVYVWQQES